MVKIYNSVSQGEKAPNPRLNKFQKTKRKDFTKKEEVKTNISDEEIILAEPTELYDEAKEIAQNTTADEKYPFTLQYDANQKDFLQSMLQMVGAVVEDDNDDGHTLSTRMNMTQLAFIKRLESVERVKTDEGRNPFLMEEAEQPATVAETTAVAEATQTAQVMTLAADEAVAVTAEEPAMANANDGIATACESGSTGSSCCTINNSMASATEIPVNVTAKGNFCCPGTEQWFKFTPSGSGEYSIYTIGSLDTVGELCDCCGETIASNDDFYQGKLNFRIDKVLEANTTYYIKVTEAKSDTGTYHLRVTDKILVDKVTISPSKIVLEKGKTYQLPMSPNHTYIDDQNSNSVKPISNFELTITPTNAAEQRVSWGKSENLENYENPVLQLDRKQYNGISYQTVTAIGDGIATLRAYDWNEQGERGECKVYVGGEPVTGIMIDRSKTLALGDSEYLFETVLPKNASNKNVTWSSSKPNVVSVDEEGLITAHSEGSAIITVKTVEGNYTASCTVTVDPRPKVIIEEDNEGAYDFFKVTFPKSEGGLVWKSIGEDLSKLNQIMSHHWSRYYENEVQAFSNKQLALLYRLDPLGVEYYVNRRFSGNSVDMLRAKDNIYIEIFGKKNGHFYFLLDENNQPQYIQRENVSDGERKLLYSNAEVLFGAHDAPSLTPMIANIAQKVLEGLFSSIPGYDAIKQGVELYQALFFSDSVSDITDLATDYMKKYIEDMPDSIAKNMLGWASNLIDFLKDVYSTLESIIPPNLNDIEIYHTMQKQPYRIEFASTNLRLSMKDIIDCCEIN